MRMKVKVLFFCISYTIESVAVCTSQAPLNNNGNTNQDEENINKSKTKQERQ